MRGRKQLLAARSESTSPVNITWRQKVGGSAIEASKIAGHTNVSMTGNYTTVQLGPKGELMPRIQDKRAKAVPDPTSAKARRAASHMPP